MNLKKSESRFADWPYIRNRAVFAFGVAPENATIHAMKRKYQILFQVGLFILSMSFLPSLLAADYQPLFARAEMPTPVLNTADFRSVFGGADGNTLNRDSSGLVRAVEFVALPGTVFQIENSYKIADALIYRVRTADYPPQKSGLYIEPFCFNFARAA